MTQIEIEYINKLNEYIRKADKLMGNWESSHIELTKLREEISKLESEIVLNENWIE